MLGQGRLEGGIISERQPIGKCPPDSMTELAAFQQHDHQPWPVFWVKTNKARLVGRMLHWRDESDRLCSEGVYHLAERRRLAEDTLSAQLLVANAKLLPGSWTNILSNWNDGGNYFHWMLDGLTRLAVREQLPETTGFFLPKDPARFVTETIQLLGLEEFARPAPSGTIRPETYYFCAPTSMTGVWNPLGYQWLRNRFSQYFETPASGSPVFLTRRGAARAPENLAEIEQLFSNSGFTIIDCGTLTVREQIRKISAAPAIAGLHGAAMTNILWATAGTPVLELFQPGYLNACYEQIAFHGRLAYTHAIMDPHNSRNGLSLWIRNQQSGAGSRFPHTQ